MSEKKYHLKYSWVQEIRRGFGVIHAFDSVVTHDEMNQHLQTLSYNHISCHDLQLQIEEKQYE